MSIQIEQASCVGCRRCERVCPGSLIEVKEGKAQMMYPKDCWGCASCIKECATGAIRFFLGADIGGNGSVLRVKKDGDLLRWQIERRDGTQEEIVVDRRNANQY